MPPAPSRPPADVAHRLAALAAHRATSVPVPRVVPVAVPVGWTPRAPAAGAGAPSGGSGVPTEDLPEDDEPEDDEPEDEAGKGEPGDEPGNGDPGNGEPGVDPPGAAAGIVPGAPPHPGWDPSVTSALAHAAASRPRAAPRTRWVPGWRAAGAAALVLALAAGGIALRAWTTPHGEPVAVPTPAVDAGVDPVAGPDAAPGTAEQGAAGDPAQQVVVHVVGAVVAPGVVHLGLGSRVADALDAAGGTLPDAELAAVNLARVLVDGEQLVVPLVGAAPPAAAVAAAVDDGLVDLNRADATALQELPGVGPVLAGRIVDRRAERPFTTVDELDEVSGVGPSLMAQLRPRVRV